MSVFIHMSMYAKSAVLMTIIHPHCQWEQSIFFGITDGYGKKSFSINCFHTLFCSYGMVDDTGAVSVL